MKEKNGEHPFGDAGQIVLLALFLIVWIADSFILRETTFLAAFIPIYARLVLMGMALGVAAYFFRSGHVVVSHGQRPDHVMSDGAFGYVRHPLYLGSILTYLGLTIVTASLASLTLFIIILAFYNYIASYEEKLLLSKFGEDYARYRQSTGRWIPRIGRRRLTKTDFKSPQRTMDSPTNNLTSKKIRTTGSVNDGKGI
jgi:protein-S-isoprenylcysteine O-methyltransferase Ste14